MLARVAAMTRPTARQLWQLLEAIHAVTYFSAEPLAALSDAGYKGYWMGYFAQRSAPLGAASAELVEATFFNFSTDRVHKALPSAWTFAQPEVALMARLSGSVAALSRIGAAHDGALDRIDEAAELALTAALSAPLSGLPLYAAHRSVPTPESSLGRLWHAATLLREHRGDGHIATLVTEGISGRTSHVLHALGTGLPPEMYQVTRDFTAEEWAAERGRLERRGLVKDGRLTAEGQSLKDHIEQRTDELAERAYETLSDDECRRLHDAARPLALAVAASGDIPIPAPMGIDLSQI